MSRWKPSETVALALGAGALVLASVLGASAQVQNAGQQTCLNAVNKDGAAVAKTQGQESVACVKSAGKGTLVGSAQTCLTADVKGKVAKAKGKTTADATKSCGAPPSFGFTGAANVNSSAQQAEVDLVADVYGGNLDGAIIPCDTNKPGCSCQQSVSKNLEALAAVKFATFVACKKAALKGGANSSAALADCVRNVGTAGSIAADSKGKIAKTFAKLGQALSKCTVALGTTFPGTCSPVATNAFAACLDTQVECRVCTAINAMDGIFVNCDLFDNGLPDSSCLSGSLPTPTPTPTSTPTATPTNTPTPTATPTCVGTAVVVGALTQTTGRFNYNLQIGLPAANAACNTAFTCTHACTYQDLQAGQTAGELVGLKDTGNNSVTSFWAIDNTAAPLDQCQDDTPGTGTLRNWEYPTAHTASRGEKVALTNGTGVLGPLQTMLQCNFSSAWVGCCQ